MPPKRKRGRAPGSKSKTSKRGLPKKSNKSNKHLRCHVCLKTFTSLIGYLSHSRGVCEPRIDTKDLSELTVNKATISCEECPKKFVFQKSYEEHCLNEHSKVEGSVACNLCTVSCPSKEVLVDHIKKIHERDLYLCPTCNKEFVRRSHVLRHMSQTGCGGLVSSYLCEICNAKFSRKDNLMVHIRLQHIVKNFYCKQCDYKTKNFSKLVRHWNNTHAEPVLQCHHCGKYTSSRAAMTKHLEIHGEKKYGCEECGYTTHTIEVMRRHVLTHVQDKPFKCDVCGKSYIQRVQLQRHQETHNTNACGKCDLTFPSRAKLLVHMRTHGGLNKFNCPIKSCTLSDKDFITETNLENHLKSHLEDKSHSCEVCSKRFQSEVNLRRHLETHTLDRPRRCMYCVSARAYVRGEQLVRHVRRHHAHVFRAHLLHVRAVLGVDDSGLRVKKSELESVLTLLDADTERILQGCSGLGVLYGGMQDTNDSAVAEPEDKKATNGPLMSERELIENLKKLLVQLIDKDTLDLFGWPDKSVDDILEKVIEQCGAKPADRSKWTRVQRLRENSKHLFLYVIEDKVVARMLTTHTIDQIIKHILAQVSDGQDQSDTSSAQ